MNTTRILDVTLLEPRRKHPAIFELFDSLDSGETFMIHNDHDPKPLYYQLLGERGEVFTWEYISNGPEFWRVKIGKKEAGKSEPTIGELAAADYRKAAVFKKFGLDFCCGGKKTVAKACAEKGLDTVEVEKELKLSEVTPASSENNYHEWEAGFLADYIVNTHHRYVTRTMPLIYEFTQKVARVHGKAHPEAVLIADYFEQAMTELNHHMMKEEEILFPYIRSLSEAKSGGEHLRSFSSVRQPIMVMEDEHEEVGRLFEKIRALSNSYTPPQGACTTFKLTYASLKEFEADLHQHIHLENNILFPAAVRLEQELNSL